MGRELVSDRGGQWLPSFTCRSAHQFRIGCIGGPEAFGGHLTADSLLYKPICSPATSIHTARVVAAAGVGEPLSTPVYECELSVALSLAR